MAKVVTSTYCSTGATTPSAQIGPTPRPSAVLAGSGPDGVIGGAGITGTGATCGSGSYSCSCSPGGEGALPSPSNPNLSAQTYCWGSCLVGDERVAVADGSCKTAAEIQKGDILLTLLGDGSIGTETVVATFGSVEKIFRVLHEHGELRCSGAHRLIMYDGIDEAVSGLKGGDALTTADGEPTKIYAILEEGTAPVFGWTCAPTHTFVASGLLHHNKPALPNIAIFNM